MTNGREVSEEQINLYGEIMRQTGRLEGIYLVPTNYITDSIKIKTERELVGAIRKYQQTVPKHTQDVLRLDGKMLEDLINRRTREDRQSFQDLCESAGIFKKP